MTYQRLSCAVLLMLAPFFFFSGPEYHEARSLHELWNLGHVFYFAAFVWCLFFNKRLRWLSGMVRAYICVVLTLVVGGAVEVAQLYVPGRIASLGDLKSDISGSLIALLLVGIMNTKSKIVRSGGISCLLGVLVLTLFSPVVVGMDEFRGWKDFPLLADFENDSELERWESTPVHVQRVASPVRSGQWSLRVTFTTEKYSGLSLVYFPRDWRGYDALCCSVYNPGDKLWLHIRVHDGQHELQQEYSNRFNRKILLKNGWNEIRLDMYDIVRGPRERPMDLADIRGLGIFVMEERRSRIVYIDNIRLE